MAKIPGTPGEGAQEQEFQFVPREREEYVPMGQVVEYDEGGFAKLTFIITPLKAVTVVLAGDHAELLADAIKDNKPSAVIKPGLVVPS